MKTLFARLTCIAMTAGALVHITFAADCDWPRISYERLRLPHGFPGAYDPAFQPIAPKLWGNHLLAMAVQPDGKIIVAGDFTWLQGVRRTGVARLNSDGTADSTFNADPIRFSSARCDIAVQPDGRIVIAGVAIETAPNEAIRLHPNGSRDHTFQPSVSLGTAEISQLRAVQSDGKLIITRTWSAGPIRLNLDGSLDDTFHSPVVQRREATSVPAVQSLSLDGDGKILIAGNITRVNGLERSLIARLHKDGTLDTSFVPQKLGDDLSQFASAIAIQPDGRILVAITYQNGAPGGHRIVRLNSDGSLDTTFAPTQQVIWTFALPGGSYTGGLSLKLQTDGKVLIYGGRLRLANGRPQVIRLNANGTLDESFQPGEKLIVADSEYHGELFPLPDGFILYREREGMPRRMTPNGSLETNFATWAGGGGDTPDPEDRVVDVKVLRDGKLLVSGNFMIHGIAVSGIARLHSDGVMDQRFGGPKTRFETRRVIGGYSVVALQSDGNILLASPEWFGRLLSNGAVDESFSSPLTPAEESERRSGAGEILAMAIQADGKLVIGGSFRSIGGAPRAGIARLNANGSLDPTFAPDASFATENIRVGRIIVQADQKLILTTDVGLFRLNMDGSVDLKDIDLNWRSAPDWPIALQADGKLWVSRHAGFREHLERLNPDWTRDTGVDLPVMSECSFVSAITVQPNGRILVAGGFSWIGGVDRYGIARLHPDGTVDATFNAGAGFLRESVFPHQGSYDLTGLVLDSRGDVIAFGGFTSVNYSGPALLARLHNGEWPVIVPQSIRRSPDGTVQFQVHGEAGQTAVVEAAASLDSSPWTAVSTNTLSGDAVWISDYAPNAATRYYRATVR